MGLLLYVLLGMCLRWRKNRDKQDEVREASKRTSAKRIKIIELHRDGFEVDEIVQVNKRSIASVRGTIIHRGIYKHIDEERALSRAERMAESRGELPLLVAGTKVPIETLQENFAAVSMTRMSQVSEAGQFSMRGGFVDYFKWGKASIS